MKLKKKTEMDQIPKVQQDKETVLVPTKLIVDGATNGHWHMYV